jgi:hypothetical protein
MEHWETEWSHDVLKRIVALLFSLANLADLAADLPFLPRRRVLGILSRGEAEARAFLIGTSPDATAPADAPEQSGDVARLAARLRALALLLIALLTQPLARSGAAGSPAPRAERQKPVGLACRLASPALDTS